MKSFINFLTEHQKDAQLDKALLKALHAFFDKEYDTFGAKTHAGDQVKFLLDKFTKNDSTVRTEDIASATTHFVQNLNAWNSLNGGVLPKNLQDIVTAIKNHNEAIDSASSVGKTIGSSRSGKDKQ
jgi:hypothetical protein